MPECLALRIIYDHERLRKFIDELHAIVNRIELRQIQKIVIDAEYKIDDFKFTVFGVRPKSWTNDFH